MYCRVTPHSISRTTDTLQKTYEPVGNSLASQSPPKSLSSNGSSFVGAVYDRAYSLIPRQARGHRPRLQRSSPFRCCGKPIVSFITYVMRLRPDVFFIAIVYAICPFFAAAQGGRAELFGVIRDSSGGAIPGAAVQAKTRRRWFDTPQLRTTEGNTILSVCRPAITWSRWSSRAFACIGKAASRCGSPNVRCST